MIETVSIPYSVGSITAYSDIPDTPEKHPALILIHEMWGLNDNIKDIAHRLQLQGYVVLAPDLLLETGITEKLNLQLQQEIQNPATRDEAQKKMRDILTPIHSPEFAEKTLAKVQACFDYLEKNTSVNGKIGVVGFCLGGTYSFALAITQPKLKAAVIFYGHPPENFEKLEDITCPVLAFYGENDTKLASQVPELNEAMAQFHKSFQAVVYPGCGHAFFNDTNLNMYNKEAADDAWERMVDMLKINLQS